MILGVGNAELQSLKVDSAAERKACRMGGAGGVHLVGTAEVVAKPDVELAVDEPFCSQHEVVDEDAAALELLAGGEVVVRRPARQVNHRERDADGCMSERLGDAHFEVGRQRVSGVAEAFDLSAKVACGHGEREVRVLVEVVKSEVCRQSRRGVWPVVRVDELRGNAASPLLAQEVAVLTGNTEVEGAERADFLAREERFLRGAVPYETCVNAPVAALADLLRIGCRACVRALHIGHKREADRFVADAGEQGGVLQRKRNVVLYQGDVLAAECRGMRRDGQVQEVEHGAALLCRHKKRGARSEEQEQKTSYLCHYIQLSGAKVRLLIHNS